MRVISWLFGSHFTQIYGLCVVISWIIVRRNAALQQRFCSGWSRGIAAELGLSLAGGLLGGLAVSLLCQGLGWGIDGRSGAILSLLALVAAMLGAGPWSLPAAALVLAWAGRVWLPGAALDTLWPLIGLGQMAGGALWLLEEGGHGAVAVVNPREPTGVRLLSRLWVMPFLGAGPVAGLLGSVPLVFPVGLGILAGHALPRKVFTALAVYMAMGGAALLVVGLLPMAQTVRLLVATAVLVLWGGVGCLLNRRMRRAAPWAGQPARGLRVLEVIPGSPAQSMGLQPGDVVEQVNGLDIMQTQKLERLLRALPSRVSLRWRRGERILEAAYEDDHQGVGELGLVFLPRDGSQTLASSLSTWRLWFSSMREH